MMLKNYKPYTSSIRTKIKVNFGLSANIKFSKKLKKYNHRFKGRNNSGHITIRHKGGGHKKLYRFIDFLRNKYNILGEVVEIQYDPYRSANIALIKYMDGEYKYILSPENIKIGDKIASYNQTDCSNIYNIGYSYPLKLIPLGAKIYNIELTPGKGGQLVRAAGTYAYILTKEKTYVIIQLPSKEIRIIKGKCCATIGQASNSENYLKKLGKAGTKRWMGIRPTVRGSAMNAVDHPHGGGEGRSPVGKKYPTTPWGKPTLGFRTRKKKKCDLFIVKKRYVK
jgi:large subunit ribosomal protein L2